MACTRRRQVPVSAYMANNRFEVVDLRDGDWGSAAGGEDKACAGPYRTGMRAERLCACNESVGASNCAGAGGAAETVVARLARAGGQACAAPNADRPRSR